MIQLNNLSLSFGQHILFKNIFARIAHNQKIGLVGRNGAGKSTLLKVIARLQNVDSGTVVVQKGIRIAYLPQEVVLGSNKTIIDETFSAFNQFDALFRECQDIENKFADSSVSHDPKLLERYAHVQEELVFFNKEQAVIQTKKVLIGLGFCPQSFEQKVSALSTGWKMRVILAKLLLTSADFYLFDEPTNHLDLSAKEWFCQFLQKNSTGFLLVSHDKYFLDAACNQIFELEKGNAVRYVGNYTSYVCQKERDIEGQIKKYNEQQKEIKRKQALIDKFRAKSSKAKFAQTLIRELEKIERIQMPDQHKDLAFTFPAVARAGKVVLTVDDVSVGYDTQSIIDHISFEVQRGEKVALLAPNGVGKTTLFKAITGNVAIISGDIRFGHNVQFTCFEQDQNKVLKPENTILQEVEDACTSIDARKQVRSFLGRFLFPGDDVYKKISVLSGGEKNRIAMVKVLLQDANLLLLDEPTNHLDLTSKTVLLAAVRAYKGSILFVSHDREFVQEIATKIVELQPDKAIVYPGNYQSYLYYKQQNSVNRQDGFKQQSFKQEHTKKNKINKPSYEVCKKIKSLEEKIERLEVKLAQEQEALSVLYSKSADYTAQLAVVEKVQHDLNMTMDTWQKLFEAFDQ